jgi:hypothetical protein
VAFQESAKIAEPERPHTLAATRPVRDIYERDTVGFREGYSQT